MIADLADLGGLDAARVVAFVAPLRRLIAATTFLIFRGYLRWGDRRSVGGEEADRGEQEERKVSHAFASYEAADDDKRKQKGPDECPALWAIGMRRLLLERTLGVVALLLWGLGRHLLLIIALLLVIALLVRVLRNRGLANQGSHRRRGRHGATASSGTKKRNRGEKEGGSQERGFYNPNTLRPRQGPENTYFISII